MKRARSILRVVFNKYVLTFLTVAVWIMFLDKNNVFSQVELKKMLNKLESEKRYFTEQIDQNKQGLDELKTSPVTLEEFARETYMMKKDEEDIFVIVPESAR